MSTLTIVLIAVAAVAALGAVLAFYLALSYSRAYLRVAASTPGTSVRSESAWRSAAADRSKPR